ncbi:MAG: exodeoxyribonuclease V subunit alpha [Fulvimonas sp.]|nr:exodeoxyribonuclease V subunit alpha [Fulvimonas sp.]
MSAFGFDHGPELPAEAAWRPLDRALWRWTRAHGGSPLLARLAAWAAFADGEGDAALPLAGGEALRYGLAPLDDARLAALRNEPLLGDGRVPTPFVLDAAGRFYLWRNHADECALATLLGERLATSAAAPVDEADLDALFPGGDPAAVASQREAVRRVGASRLFVLTGGPGTGKTTTVLRMLLMRLKTLPDARIAVAAPTGKAAQRLVQSLRAGRQALLENRVAPLPETWRALLDRLPDGEALTLHRLLGYDPRRNRYTRDRAHPLAADLVVVDEASMVDLPTLRALLEALRPEATLILVGDADQLAPVGIGTVLLDLVVALEARASPALVRLTHSFRAERPLAAINDAVRKGEAAALRAAFAAAGHQARWRDVAAGAAYRQALQGWAESLAATLPRPTLPAADDTAATAQALAALRALSRRQLLCALREGPHGAPAVDAWLGRRLKEAWGVPEDREWYPGRAVLVVRNDYATRLFNGDVGLCLADADDRLRVWFESTDADGRPTARAFAPAALPAHEGAFALTVHKAQGSEYAHVAVLLPPDPAQRILSRQLLYTGLSRAKAQVELMAGEAVVAAALARPLYRIGGLRERLA